MDLPFTTEQFLEVFKTYNQAVFPAQIIFYVFAIYCIYSIFKPTRNTDRIINSILSFLWLWIGIVYHLNFFTNINKAAYVFGFLFIIQGLIFFISGVVKRNLSFAYKKDWISTAGFVFLLYALIIYPVLGHLLGHQYPYSPTFGLPCPTTIFTFGLLLFTTKKISIWIIVIPLLWSFIGVSAAVNLSIYEDIGLLIAGVSGLVLLIISNRNIVKNEPV